MSQYTGKWYSSRDYNYQRLKRARDKMIRNRYNCTVIRENTNPKIVQRWVYDYQLPADVHPVPALPEEYVK